MCSSALVHAAVLVLLWSFGAVHEAELAIDLEIVIDSIVHAEVAIDIQAA
jgi:hypothetical protein